MREKKKKKKNKQTNQIREDALYIREGEEPRGKKKNSETERERRSRLEWVALKCQRGTMGGWVGYRSEWVTLRLARGPGSRAVVRWSGSGVVWLDRVVGSLVLQRILRSFEVLVFSGGLNCW